MERDESRGASGVPLNKFNRCVGAAGRPLRIPGISRGVHGPRIYICRVPSHDGIVLPNESRPHG